MSAPVVSSGSATSARFGALLTATVIALLIGGALWRLAPESAGLLAPAAFTREARAHLLPALHQSPGEIWQHADALAHAWGTAVVALTGQWDARLLSITALFFHAGALATLLLALRRELSFGRLTLLALAGLVFSALALTSDTGTGAHALAGAWLWLTLLQLWLTQPGKSPTSAALGCLAGGLNIVASSLGFAAALAQLARDFQGRAPRSRIVASGLLVLVGAAVGLWRIPGEAATISALAFPFSTPWLTLLVWAPASLALWRWSRGEASSLHFVAPLVLAFVAATLVLLATGGEVARSWMLGGLLINVAALAVLPWPPAGAARTRLFVLAAVWLIAVGNALVQPLTRPEPGRYEPVAESADDLARPAADALAASSHLRGILPAPWRAPLSVTKASGNEAFGSAAPAELAAPDRLPWLSSWSPANGAAAEGEFRSTVLE